MQQVCGDDVIFPSAVVSLLNYVRAENAPPKSRITLDSSTVCAHAWYHNVALHTPVRLALTPFKSAAYIVFSLRTLCIIPCWIPVGNRHVCSYIGTGGLYLYNCSARSERTVAAVLDADSVWTQSLILQNAHTLYRW